MERSEASGNRDFLRTNNGHLTSVNAEEGGAKRSGSVLDLLANAAAQTG